MVSRIRATNKLKIKEACQSNNNNHRQWCKEVGNKLVWDLECLKVDYRNRCHHHSSSRWWDKGHATKEWVYLDNQCPGEISHKECKDYLKTIVSNTHRDICHLKDKAKCRWYTVRFQATIPSVGSNREISISNNSNWHSMEANLHHMECTHMLHKWGNREILLRNSIWVCRISINSFSFKK